jgi:hypothetical protein
VTGRTDNIPKHLADADNVHGRVAPDELSVRGVVQCLDSLVQGGKNQEE